MKIDILVKGLNYSVIFLHWSRSPVPPFQKVIEKKNKFCFGIFENPGVSNFQKCLNYKWFFDPIIKNTEFEKFHCRYAFSTNKKQFFYKDKRKGTFYLALSIQNTFLIVCPSGMAAVKMF